jgi:hypothetical protein
MVALAASILGNAQQKELLATSKGLSTQTRETIFVHANTTTFVIGETLYCKVYCLGSADYSPSNVSRIAYIELIDNSRKSVFKQKLYLQNGIGQGDFFIPTTLKTGNYKLVAYTQWTRNETDFAYAIDISVVNPFQPLDKNGIVAATQMDVNPVSSESFALSTDKKSYGLREKVSLSIQSLQPNGKGNYSVSVRKLDGLPSKSPLSAKAFLQNESNKDKNAFLLKHIPELRGELLSGKIISKKGAQDLNHKTVALSITGKSFAVKIAETDREGRFTFILDEQSNANQMTIQVVDEARNDFSIQLDEAEKPDWSALRFEPEAPLDPELKTTIEERSVASQVENAYYAQKKDSIAPAVSSDSFFHSDEKEYVLDDYTRFPSVKETITEVLKELYYTRKDGKYAINLRNYVNNNEAFGAPLLLVDGLVIQDANELFDYNPENIYKFSIINEPYVYGPKTFSGVINIATKNQDYETKAKGDFIRKVESQRPLNRKFYFRPDYALNANKRIPDYRHQLLWEPTLTLENASNPIIFYTSDVAGKYEIVLEGFTSSGLPVSIKDSFEVK